MGLTGQSPQIARMICLTSGRVRGCIRRGSRYALIIGDKVYALDTNDKSALAELDSWLTIKLR